ncbi:hypothetical protein P7K49_003739 [Saguinus oedipus]|uniref:Small EDRK-rich factor 2 n=1 Tax=Saguinus oedipus TaxID=9490 RepID=A0ABQ9W5D7_SAGOE|nr:hypothetical protein P7K49_003739 [Saguinus oedipus]
MTSSNQRELAHQKNMKKQSDLVKGKRRDDGLSAAARKQRDSEIMQQKQKKANEKKEEPNTRRGSGYGQRSAQACYALAAPINAGRPRDCPYPPPKWLQLLT